MSRSRSVNDWFIEKIYNSNKNRILYQDKNIIRIIPQLHFKSKILRACVKFMKTSELDEAF